MNPWTRPPTAFEIAAVTNPLLMRWALQRRQIPDLPPPCLEKLTTESMTWDTLFAMVQREGRILTFRHNLLVALERHESMAK
jgi:hypothetical protein